MPTSWGRSASAARNNATSSGARFTGYSKRLVERALARFHQLEETPDGHPLEVLAGTVRLERRLVAVLLVDEERPRIFRGRGSGLGLATRLLTGCHGELACDPAARSSSPSFAFIRTTRTNDISPSFPLG